MKTIVAAIAISVTCASTTAPMQQAKPTSLATALPPELEYDAYCKKTSQEKRSLFRAATPAQKALIMRRQVERFREANRARLTKDQLALLSDLLARMTAASFDGSADARTKLAALSDRVEDAFSSADQDQMDRDGPCIPGEKG
jgi:hypothetical protein